MIDKILECYSCPYCKHTAKSSSGRTLHRKSCKEKSSHMAAQKKYKVGQKVKFRGKEGKIKELKEGLAALDNGEIAACGKLSKTSKKESRKITYSSPRTALEWVDIYIAKHREKQENDVELRKYIAMLFSLSSYTAHRKWTKDQLEEALDRRLPWPKSSNSSAAKMSSARPKKSVTTKSN